MEEPYSKKPRVDDVEISTKQAINLINVELENINCTDLSSLADTIYLRVLSPMERSKITTMNFGFEDTTRIMVQSIRDREQLVTPGQSVWNALSKETQAYWIEQAQAGKKTPTQLYEASLEFIADVNEKLRVLGDTGYPHSILKLPKLLVLMITEEGMGVDAIRYKCRELGTVADGVLSKYTNQPAFWEAMAHRDIRKPIEEGMNKIEILLTRLSKLELGGKQNYNHLLNLYRKQLPETLRQLDELIEGEMFTDQTYMGFFRLGAHKMVAYLVGIYVNAIIIDGKSSVATEYFTDPNAASLCYVSKGSTPLLSFGLGYENRREWSMFVTASSDKSLEIADIDIVSLEGSSTILLDVEEDGNLEQAAETISSVWITTFERMLTSIHSPSKFKFSIDVSDLAFMFEDDDSEFNLLNFFTTHPDRLIMSAGTCFSPIFAYPDFNRRVKKMPSKFLIPPSEEEESLKVLDVDPELLEENETKDQREEFFMYTEEDMLHYRDKIEHLLGKLPVGDEDDSDHMDEDDDEDSSD